MSRRFNDVPDSEQRIREYFRTRYNIEIPDADMPEVRQSMFYLGSAIARYVVLQEEKRNTKSIRG